jgi:predicted Zn-dependent protease
VTIEKLVKILLEARWHIYAHANKWEACVDIADAIVKLDPDRAQTWIHRSFALHELKRMQEAFDQLVPVADSFPQVWTIPYNLACYCAQLGRPTESEAWLKKAMAINDLDLRPLWDSMSGTMWKRTG